MAKESSKLEVKWEDAIRYGYNVLKNYPGTEKFLIAQDTRQSMWEIGKWIQQAVNVKNTRKKIYYMEQADEELAKLKMLVQAACMMKFLSPRQMGIWASHLNEMGRMIGGWLRSVA